jgi:hypothetical protein
MGYANAQVRAKTLDDGRHLRQALYPVENKKYLSSSFRFKIDRIPDQIFAVCAYFGLNWLTVWRRRIDNAQVSRPHQAEL